MNPLLFLLAVMMLCGCGANFANMAYRLNVLDQLGESDEHMIESTCKTAAKEAKSLEQLGRIEIMCRRGLQDVDVFRADYAQAMSAIEKRADGDYIDVLLEKVEVDEQILVRDLQDIQREM